ncbi:unnamed protein product [Heligmosomoides polygyrus]|uniref:Uncharacterized protein n=1 Tax=Heligmosomoides polygyrus TaxID=6339 RepID=A0A3P7WK50_HELPZ|nr:unnamed protein product [Heligmosomoides polygyrus]
MISIASQPGLACCWLYTIRLGSDFSPAPGRDSDQLTPHRHCLFTCCSLLLVLVVEKNEESGEGLSTQHRQEQKVRERLRDEAVVVLLVVVVEQAKPPSPRNCSIEVQPRIQLLSNFRVSFGNDAVKTFIYEKESEEATPILHRQSFTDGFFRRELAAPLTGGVDGGGIETEMGASGGGWLLGSCTCPNRHRPTFVSFHFVSLRCCLLLPFSSSLSAFKQRQQQQQQLPRSENNGAEKKRPEATKGGPHAESLQF